MGSVGFVSEKSMAIGFGLLLLAVVNVKKGLPDWVIQAQVGHVAPQMMKTYSYVRRLALDQAAAAFESKIYPTSKVGDELVN